MLFSLLGFLHALCYLERIWRWQMRQTQQEDRGVLWLSPLSHFPSPSLPQEQSRTVRSERLSRLLQSSMKRRIQQFTAPVWESEEVWTFGELPAAKNISLICHWYQYWKRNNISTTPYYYVNLLSFKICFVSFNFKIGTFINWNILKEIPTSLLHCKCDDPCILHLWHEFQKNKESVQCQPNSVKETHCSSVQYVQVW